MSLEPHLQITRVCKTFESQKDPLVVLDGITLDVHRGEFLSILGPSGCGKSTLLRILGGLFEPTSGSISIDGDTPKAAQGSKAIGFVFQEPALLPWRTVEDNIRLPLEVNQRQGNSYKHTADDLIELIGLNGFGHYYPFQLSGGMQQRVGLARAVVLDPSLLLMDEPLGSLDEITRSAMRYELLRIWELDKKTVVFVTHSITEAIIMSDRVVVMSSLPGRIKGIVSIDLPRPRTEKTERSPEFLSYVDKIHEMLRGAQ